MNISTNKQKLSNAVLLAEYLVGKKESLPVLSCVLIDVSDRCVLRATNLEAGIEAIVPCDIKEKGVIAVPASIFSQTIRSISGDIISLKTKDENLFIESHNTKTLLKTISPEEFPFIKKEAAKKETTIPKQNLISGLQSVLYATSSSMIRPELGSVFLSIKPPGFLCAATDSFRLAEKKVDGVKNGDARDVLIPLKHATELIHVLEKTDGDMVNMAIEDSQLIVSTKDIYFVSRIVEGAFPHYQDIIPKEMTTEATLLKVDFADMLRKARIFSGGDQQVGLHLYPKRKIFSATAQSSTVGEMSDSLDAFLSGEDLDINFHIGYLSDCLSSIEADSITLSFSGIGRPLVIRGVSDSSFLYLVMPLNR